MNYDSLDDRDSFRSSEKLIVESWQFIETDKAGDSWKVCRATFDNGEEAEVWRLHYEPGATSR